MTMGACAAGPTPLAAEIEIEGLVFPSPLVSPPGSSKSYVLGGAGERGLEIGGRFVKFTAIGVYLQEGKAVAALAPRWKGKSAGELHGSADFYRDVVKGPFEKFIRVTMIVPLTGVQYSEKLTENCVRQWKASGTHTEASAKAVEKFKEFFKEATFPPGASIFFTQSPSGTLTVVFSMDEKAAEVIEDKQLSEAVLESIIGEDGVSPAAKESLASRVAELLRAYDEEVEVEVEKAAASVKETVANCNGDAPAVAVEAK